MKAMRWGGPKDGSCIESSDLPGIIIDDGCAMNDNGDMPMYVLIREGDGFYYWFAGIVTLEMVQRVASEVRGGVRGIPRGER